MLKELMEHYNPDNILHRDVQIKSIRDIFKNFKKNGIASNILIMGVTGSGKTTSIKKVVDEENNNYFGSGSITKTSFRTLRAMFDLNCNTNERLLNEIISKLKINPKILIIDEVNRIEDIPAMFNSLNTIYRETGCPVILITNKRTIFDDMPNDARLTLLFDKIEFPSYNALELYDIIKNRIDLIQEKIPNVPKGSLRKICAIAGKESSARIVLSITLKCILADDFSEKYIDKIRDNLEKEDWRDFVAGLKPSEKEFLKNIVELQSTKKDIKPSDISKCMSRFTPARISQFITAFENYGIIESKYKNMGRGGGRSRTLNFASEEIYSNIEELI